MNKWVLGSILYVAVLIGGFTAYDVIVVDQDEQMASAEMKHGQEMQPGGENKGDTMQGGENHGDMEASGDNHAEMGTSGENHGDTGITGHGHDGQSQHGSATSEVNAYVQANPKAITIYLRDKAGHPVDDLEVSHEKIFHLIMVDEQLQTYVHVHPERTGKGVFQVANTLPAGLYKAFVDIKPKNLAYHVLPVPFVVGQPSATAPHAELEPDAERVQTVDGETVKLQMSSTKANEPVTLTFDLDKTSLTPYLGAMGHVVILDEKAENFLHVHPANEQEPVFETQFQQPGIYKIWAEFKQNGKVRVFPFVVEIKGGE